MLNLTLLQQISAYVTGMYKEYQKPVLLYHNLEHTENVVKRAYEIAFHYPLNEEEKFTLFTSAWFHDTGHLFGEIAQHEQRGADLMRKYLLTKDVEQNTIDTIEKCILATKIPQHPETLIQEILCDADTHNLGTAEFYITDKMLKREYELRNNIIIDNWEKRTLHLLEDHVFFTSYCQMMLNNGRLENIKSVNTRIAKIG